MNSRVLLTKMQLPFGELYCSARLSGNVSLSAYESSSLFNSASYNQWMSKSTKIYKNDTLECLLESMKDRSDSLNALDLPTYGNGNVSAFVQYTFLS